MVSRSRRLARHGGRLRGRSLAAALCLISAAAAAAPGAADAALVSGTSTNWAGFAARRAGVSFRHVSGSWIVPPVDCSTGGARYSANWLGLGGYAGSSAALEQLGTESDCTASGRASYSAWFEVVPAAAVKAKLTVSPGDLVSAGVAVSGTVVRLRIADATRGTEATRTVHAATVDLSSAEWIVEAPSLCTGTSASDARCLQSALANFGTTSFTHASATTTGGHTGSILDSAWSAVSIALRQTGGRGLGGGPGRRWASDAAGVAGATPGPLSPAGTAFQVDYVAAP